MQPCEGVSELVADDALQILVLTALPERAVRSALAAVDAAAIRLEPLLLVLAPVDAPKPTRVRHELLVVVGHEQELDEVAVRDAVPVIVAEVGIHEARAEALDDLLAELHGLLHGLGLDRVDEVDAEV